LLKQAYLIDVPIDMLTWIKRGRAVQGLIIEYLRRAEGRFHRGPHRWEVAASAAVAALIAPVKKQSSENHKMSNTEWEICGSTLTCPWQLQVIPTLPKPYRILLTPGRSPADSVVVLQYRTSSGLVNEYEETPANLDRVRDPRAIAHEG
jgi:hypothetical protein